MATRKPRNDEEGKEIFIHEVQRGRIEFCILGTTPLIPNCMSEKAQRQLFLPEGGKKTAADKAANLKHQPYAEYQAAPYRMEDPRAPTELAALPSAFKASMRSAALDMQGSNKSQIGRLVTVVGELTPLYGIPQIFMAVTRSADAGRTPDIRTRPILPEWACRIVVEFTMPLLKQQAIINLVAAAGVQSGVGDWRQEKGSGSYGSFRIVAESDPDFRRLTKITRKQQLEALAHPQAYNTETKKLLSFFDTEVVRRGFRAEREGDLASPLIAPARPVAAVPARRGRVSAAAENAAAQVQQDEVVVAPRRGRPPKQQQEVAPPPVAAAAPRRGRPPKVVEEVEVAPYVPPAAPRGRPRKVNGAADPR